MKCLVSVSSAVKRGQNTVIRDDRSIRPVSARKVPENPRLPGGTGEVHVSPSHPVFPAANASPFPEQWEVPDDLMLLSVK